MDYIQTRDELRRRVDRGIRGFEEWYRAEKGDHYLRAEESAVLRALELEPDSTVIDAGCGAGRFTLLLAPRCRQVRAVDLSPVAVETTLERARERGLSNVTGSACDLADGVPGEPADRVVAVQVLTFFPGERNRLRAVESLRNALCPGGRLVVTVFNGGRWMDRLRGRPRECIVPAGGWYYYFRFLSGELAELFREAGLGKVRVRGLLNLPGRVYRWPGSRCLAPLDGALGRLPLGGGLGIYLLASAVRV